MNKEIRENFTKWRDSDFKERFNKLSFVGFAPSMDKASLFAWMGYQQAVKDMEAENQWIECSDRLPKCKHEIEEWDGSGENCTFHGNVSQSVEISDGYKLARGHYRDNGTWNIYDAEHDFQLVEPEEITHWKPMLKGPNA